MNKNLVTFLLVLQGCTLLLPCGSEDKKADQPHENTRRRRARGQEADQGFRSSRLRNAAARIFAADHSAEQQASQVPFANPLAGAMPAQAAAAPNGSNASDNKALFDSEGRRLSIDGRLAVEPSPEQEQILRMYYVRRANKELAKNNITDEVVQENIAQETQACSDIFKDARGISRVNSWKKNVDSPREIEVGTGLHELSEDIVQAMPGYILEE